ncbi:glucokinase [Moritella sp. F3]|uniref:glucokinase n=1 Tax=Moritella sp. F3 TaxID=2718882 RepID=UPI0018E0D9A2|nr:glucokinase [Moritella sp. F3]GIC76690.1 glucokinase [Moritella sp. F1]GIC80293.1 glucokinase [Moritella sp. F3]
MLSVVADIGGTNIRLAVCDVETGMLSKLNEFACAEFTTLEAALVQYFEILPGEVKHLCIGIACPVENDHVAMTNLSWTFSKQVLQDKLQLASLYVINDYTAISLAVPFLSPEEKIQIGGGEIQVDGTTAVFGPGTGLGVSHIVKSAGKWVSLDGEGGHVSFSVNTREQADILFLLQAQFGHVSAERILSGQGLVNVYTSLCTLSDQSAKFDQPKDVSKAALDGSCDIARRSLDIFCQVMGSFAGNLALNLACTGGVYIAGGIVPRFTDLFQSSDFRHFFEEKGRFKSYLSSIPTFLIRHDNPGLLGASVYLRQELESIK